MIERGVVEGRMAALRIDNLDTDQLVPKQFLRIVGREELAREALLHDMRFDSAGQPKPDFVLNRTEFCHAKVLLGGQNFGCGSSREHAVWALLQHGIDAVIAPSFAEIFFGNAINNGLLLVTLPSKVVTDLMDEADDALAPGTVRISVPSMTVESRSTHASFTLSKRERTMVLEGLDAVGLSLTYKTQIEAFAAGYRAHSPWLLEVRKSKAGR